MAACTHSRPPSVGCLTTVGVYQYVDRSSRASEQHAWTEKVRTTHLRPFYHTRYLLTAFVKPFSLRQMVASVQKGSPMVVKAYDDSFPILTTNKRPRTSRSERNVQFAENRMVLEIPTRAGFSQQELNLLYLSKSEHKRIQLEIVDLIREYKLGQKSWREEEEIERLRGLEPLTNHDDGGRLRRMKNAVSAIVDRQLNGSIDEMWLSKVYRPYSRSAQSLAYKRAEMDRHAAFSDAPRRIIMSR